MTDTIVSNDDLDSRKDAADAVEAIAREAEARREETSTEEDGKLISCPIPTVQKFGSFA